MVIYKSYVKRELRFNQEA